MKTRLLVFLFTILSFASKAQDRHVHFKPNYPSKIIDSLNNGRIEPYQARAKLISYQSWAKRKGKVSEAIDTYYYLPWTFYAEANYNEVIKTYQKGIKEALEFTSTPIDTIRFKLLSDLGSLYLIDNNLVENLSMAYQLYKSNIEIEKSVPTNLLSLLNNYAYYHQLNGDWEQSVIYLKEAQRIGKTYLKDPELLSYVYRNLGRAYYFLNQKTETEKYYLLAVQTSKEALNKAKGLYDLGILYQETNRPVKAETSFHNSIKTITHSGFAKKPLGQIVVQRNQLGLAKSSISRGDYNSALKKVLLVKQNPISVLEQLDAILIQLEIPNHNLDTLYEAGLVLSNTNLTNYTSISPNHTTAILYKKAEKTKAISDYQNLVNWLSHVRQNNIGSQAKFRVSAEVHDLTSEVLKYANSQNAFEFLELTKAAELLEINRRINIKEPFVKELAHLDRKISSLSIKATEYGLDSTLSLKIRQAQIEQSILSQKIKKENPTYYQENYFWKPAETKEIQKKLKPKELLISYFMDETDIYIYVIENNKKGIIKLQKDTEFDNRLLSFINNISLNPGLGVYNSNSEAQFFYSKLIEPISDYLKGVENLTIIRDGLLNILPYEVLAYATDSYLLEKYSITYNYSSTLALEQRVKKNLSDLTNILAFAPYTNQGWTSSLFRNKSLGQLPFSDSEVNQIDGTVYKNENATKIKFLEKYQKHGIIHFATHAQMDDTDPSKSFISFFPDSSDYKLYTEELYNLSLKNTQLVVLSACEAGGGKLQKGEGLMSLARGFAYAGCPAVITTLWKANDQSTAWLSERLHHYLSKGWNKAKALRQAKLDFRASDIGQEFDHPYYWANFILIGDDAPLQMTLWDEYKWRGLGILLLIALLYLINNSKAINRVFKTKA